MKFGKLKKACLVLVALVLLLSTCVVLGACEKTDLRKNSKRDTDLIERYFTSTGFLAYGSFVSGEQILGSRLIAESDKATFSEYNDTLPESAQYYDVYNGRCRSEIYTPDGRLATVRYDRLIVIVPLVDTSTELTFLGDDGYNFDEDWAYLYSFSNVMQLLAYYSGSQAVYAPNYRPASMSDEAYNRGEYGGITEFSDISMSFIPETSDGTKWQEQYSISIEGKIYTVTQQQAMFYAEHGIDLLSLLVKMYPSWYTYSTGVSEND